MANLMNEHDPSPAETGQSQWEEEGENDDVDGESDLWRSRRAGDDDNSAIIGERESEPADDDRESCVLDEQHDDEYGEVEILSNWEKEGGEEEEEEEEEKEEGLASARSLEEEWEEEEEEEEAKMGRNAMRQRLKAKRNSDDPGQKSSNGCVGDDGGRGGGSGCDGPPGDNCGPRNGRRKSASGRLALKTFAFLVLLSLLPVGYVVYWHRDRLARQLQVTARLEVPGVIGEQASSALRSPERFWGTYRPGVYFGMKTRTPHSLVTGLMWFTQFSRDRQLAVRHTCEQEDQLPRYGWLQHDGINFGIQEIVDNNFTLKTEFVKRPGGMHGGDWTARISGKARNKVSNKTIVSLIFYTALDQDNGSLQPITKGNQLLEIRGSTQELGAFTLRFPQTANAKKHNYVSTHSPGVHLSKQVVMQSLKRFPYSGSQFMAGLAGDILASRGLSADYKANFMAHQVTVALPFQMEVVFESASWTSRSAPLAGQELGRLLRKHQGAFDATFEAKFGLREKGFKKREIDFAKAALSNMLGGIGYFYGQSSVRSKHTPEPVQYWAAPLLTAVPSRSFFPRGFLWDEGFHNLLISKWDRGLSREIIGHWLDLMNAEGWIPREQILGGEARSKVPDEFVVQHNENANPPTLFLPLQSILRDAEAAKSDSFLNYLEHVFPRLEAWYRWFNTTQTGPRPLTYRWRGRDATTDKELNPKTLTSGLDDYPRASHSTDSEYHLDLRCWMALASGVMVDIARAIGVPYQDYEATHRRLSDNALLDELHWSPRGKMYSDFGLHTSAVILKRPPSPPPSQLKPGQKRPPLPPKLPMVRVVKDNSEPRERHVDAFGYISLFPFLLQILTPDSSKLGKVLADLKDPKLLWTPYGLRSLSKSDPIYMKFNTEHDPPYWRGAIWINMNFLAVRSLHHYSSEPGRHRDTARELYTKLRHNLVGNMFKEYERSGYIWENYNDSTGKGQGSHPFTGWSALVTLMMSEKY